MKNINLKPITLILSIALIIVLMAAKLPENSKQYDYVSIVQGEKDLRITTGSKFESISIKNEKEKTQDFSPLFAKINEFEALGYEVTENTVFAGAYSNPSAFSSIATSYVNYVLMRKAK
jgi:hypothetical protein